MARMYGYVHDFQASNSVTLNDGTVAIPTWRTSKRRNLALIVLFWRAVASLVKHTSMCLWDVIPANGQCADRINCVQCFMYVIVHLGRSHDIYNWHPIIIICVYDRKCMELDRCDINGQRHLLATSRASISFVLTWLMPTMVLRRNAIKYKQFKFHSRAKK